MEISDRVQGMDGSMNIWRIDDSDLGCGRVGGRGSLESVDTSGSSTEEKRVKPGDNHAEAGETSYHVLFPIAVGAVFLVALVLGAILG